MIQDVLELPSNPTIYSAIAERDIYYQRFLGRRFLRGVRQGDDIILVVDDSVNGGAVGFFATYISSQETVKLDYIPTSGLQEGKVILPEIEGLALLSVCPDSNTRSSVDLYFGSDDEAVEGVVVTVLAKLATSTTGKVMYSVRPWRVV